MDARMTGFEQHAGLQVNAGEGILTSRTTCAVLCPGGR